MTDERSLKRDSTSALTLNSATMTSTEAMKAATFLIGQFPNITKGDEIFLRSVASLFETFPRSVVEDCVNPKLGYATEFEFLSLFHVNKWCEERATRFFAQVERQKRVEQQLKERMEGPPKTERGLRMARAWLDRTDPAAAHLSGQESKWERERKLGAQARKKLIDEFGQEVFDAVPDQPLTFQKLPGKLSR